MFTEVEKYIHYFLEGEKDKNLMQFNTQKSTKAFNPKSKTKITKLISASM